MKSRITVCVFAVALATSSVILGGCDNISESNRVSDLSAIDSRNPSENSGTSDPQGSGGDNTSSETQTLTVTLDTEIKKLINEFPLDTFIGFDGKEVEKTDAISAMRGEDGQLIYLTYDFAYLRYAKPVWKNTLLDDDVIDWETYEFNDNTPRRISEPNYFSVKTGDVLDNGLSVKKALNIFYPQTTETGLEICQSRSTVNFEGQLTLSGILHCVAGDSDYVDMDGDLFFYADSSNDRLIAPSKENLKMERLVSIVDPETKFALLCDGQRFCLGNINSEDVIDLSGEINKGEYRIAAVTINDVRVVFTAGAGAYLYGTLVSVSTD